MEGILVRLVAVVKELGHVAIVAGGGRMERNAKTHCSDDHGGWWCGERNGSYDG